MKSCIYQPGDEIYTDYILNRLSSAEKQMFEGHLQDCPECRQRLEDERRFVQGIKLIGHQEMKKEIQRQIDEKKQQRTSMDWTIAFKVAAVMFFLVLMPGMIYMLNDYILVPALEPTYPLPSSSAEIRLREESAPVDARLPAEKRVSGISAPEREAGQFREPESPGPAPVAEPIHIAGSGVVKEQESLPVTSGLETILPDRQNENLVIRSSRKEPALIEIDNQDGTGRTDDQNLSALPPAAKKKIEPGEMAKGMAMSDSRDEIKTYHLSNGKPGLSPAMKSFSESADAAKTGKLRTVRFYSGSDQILIQLPLIQADIREEQSPGLPDSFAVTILNRTGNNLSMKWDLNYPIERFDPDQVVIQLINQREIRFLLEDMNCYRIDLDHANPRAVLCK